MKRQLVYDCCLLEFYEEKTQTPLLLPLKSEVSTRKYFTEQPNISYSISYAFDQLSDKIDHSVNKLLLAENRLLVYGFLLGDIIGGWAPTYYCLCFYRCNKEAMKNIIEESIKLLVADNLLIYSIKEEKDFVSVEGDSFTIKFSLVSYNDEREILQNMRGSSHKHIYNPTIGYNCTIVAGLIKSLPRNDCDIPITGGSFYRKRKKCNVITDLYQNYLSLTKICHISCMNPDILKLVYDIWIELLVYDAKDRLITQCEDPNITIQ